MFSAQALKRFPTGVRLKSCTDTSFTGMTATRRLSCLLTIVTLTVSAKPTKQIEVMKPSSEMTHYSATNTAPKGSRDDEAMADRIQLEGREPSLSTSFPVPSSPKDHDLKRKVVDFEKEAREGALIKSLSRQVDQALASPHRNSLSGSILEIASCLSHENEEFEHLDRRKMGSVKRRRYQRRNSFVIRRDRPLLGPPAVNESSPLRQASDDSLLQQASPSLYHQQQSLKMIECSSKVIGESGGEKMDSEMNEWGHATWSNQGDTDWYMAESETHDHALECKDRLDSQEPIRVARSSRAMGAAELPGLDDPLGRSSGNDDVVPDFTMKPRPSYS